jgi:Bacteriophage HK97-gp10, putative tail-component
VGAIIVQNIAQTSQALTGVAKKAEYAAQKGLEKAALSVERQAKINANTGVHARGKPHIPGTGPGPNTVTGTLRRSITTEVRYGFGTYIAQIGPTVEYARSVELGNTRWKTGNRFPFLIPAVGYLFGSGTLQRVFEAEFKRQMGA